MSADQTAQRKKSYWQSLRCIDARDHAALHAWFNGMSDGLTPYKAEVLCDVETDAEKKLRAFMVDADGHYFEYTRTLSKGGPFSITQRRIEKAAINAR